MGACSSKKKPRSALDESFARNVTIEPTDAICKQFDLYLDLVGDVASLGGYL